MGQKVSVHKPIHHHIAHSRVDHQSLRREFDEYVRRQEGGNENSTVMKRSTLVRFCEDMHSVLGLKHDEQVLALVGDADVEWNEFLAFFRKLAEMESVPLSESLQADVLDVEDGASTIVRPSATFEIADARCFVPPAQSFAREWSLVFDALETEELNRVNLTCRFFYSVLRKFPPSAFRLARVASLAERTSEHIGKDLLNWRRMRTIVRLEIGIPNLGTQFENKDLPVVVREMESLRALKLFFCPLLNDDGFLGCVGLEYVSLGYFHFSQLTPMN